MTSSSPETTDLVATDLILLLLAAPGGVRAQANRLEGITRLEKLLFLADRETDVPKRVSDPFKFEPYDFGPYSKSIYQAVDVLEQAGLMEEDRAIQGQSVDSVEAAEAIAGDELEGVERRFWLTADGIGVATLLASRHEDVAKAISKIKSQYGDMPLNRLIRYVYSKYPEYAVASKIRDRVL